MGHRKDAIQGIICMSGNYDNVVDYSSRKLVATSNRSCMAVVIEGDNFPWCHHCRVRVDEYRSGNWWTDFTAVLDSEVRASTGTTIFSCK